MLSSDDDAFRAVGNTRTLLIVALSFGVSGRLERRANKDYLLSARNFYGVLRVRDDPPEDSFAGVRVLIHGTINHGTQLLGPAAPHPDFLFRRNVRHLAIRSKGANGPIGSAFWVSARSYCHWPARVRCTITKSIRWSRIAQTKFDFEVLPADKHLYFGDGRLTLENMKESENLDFLAMDAFTSDAVHAPAHLEAYDLPRHMKPDGILAINISNRYLDLEPIIAQAAKEMGWSGIMVYDEGIPKPTTFRTLGFCDESAAISPIPISGCQRYHAQPRRIPVLTDDYTTSSKSALTDYRISQTPILTHLPFS